MRNLLSAAFAVSLLSTGAWGSTQASDEPVCIVGAGPAGLRAAQALESEGRQVVVFEKQPEVGGKSQAYYENGIYFPLGAILFANETYENTLKVISETNVIGRLYDTSQEPGWRYNWTSGAVSPAPVPPSKFQDALVDDIKRYIPWWREEFAPSFASVGYKEGVPETLTVPTEQWLRENKYTALPVIFNAGMVAYGYGDIRQTPILYTLQYFSPDVLGFFAGIGPGYLIDFHEVFVQYARNVIKGSIFTNTTVSRVYRSGAAPILTYTSNAASAPATNQTCSSVIMAFPPTISALQAAGVTLSANESEVFTPILITNYFAGAVRLSEVPRQQPYHELTASPALPPDAMAQPVAFISLHESSSIATSWSWGALGANYTYQHAYQLLKEVFSKVNKNPLHAFATGTEVTDADVKAFSQTVDYFPHFDQDKLAAGWYTKFDALQGQQNTYWASGLNGFESVEFALRAGIDVASRIG